VVGTRDLCRSGFGFSEAIGFDVGFAFSVSESDELVWFIMMLLI